jgi:serine/threonine-protein kinase
VIGERVEHYDIMRLMCVGGMARVYVARDTVLGRQVAIKALAPTLLGNTAAVERFRREAQYVAALDHPHIAPILHLIEHTDGLFLVMPLFVASLRDRLAQTPQLELDMAIRITSEIGAALAVAHAQRVVHRDVKPGNILLDHYGRAALADFGVACDEKDWSSSAADAPAESRLLVGTPLYMAPEQLSGGEVDPRADIYALGVVLYQMLTGRTPHTGNSLLAIATAVHTRLIVPPAALNPAVTLPVDAVILRALAVRPEDRFQGVTDFVTALQSCATITPKATQDFAHTATRPFLFPNWQSKLKVGQSQAKAGQHRPLLHGAVALALGAFALLLALRGGAFLADKATDPSPSGDAITQSNASGFERHLVPTSTTSPSVTLTPTQSPVSIDATSSPPTSVSAVTPPLAVGPLHLTKDHGNHCSGTQTIVNHSARTLGWRWETPSLAVHPSLVYGVNASAQMKGLPADQDPGIPPGGAETVTVQMKCTGQTYAVTVRDSLGRTQQVIVTTDN